MIALVAVLDEELRRLDSQRPLPPADLLHRGAEQQDRQQADEIPGRSRVHAPPGRRKKHPGEREHERGCVLDYPVFVQKAPVPWTPARQKDDEGCCQERDDR